jgi:LacI family transcriptional regulator
VSTITRDDVAKVAGVSPSTVSRVLSGSANVSLLKRQQVLAAVERMGYRPNIAARNLASGKTNGIGVLVPDASSVYYAEVLRGVQEGLSETSFHPVIGVGYRPTRRSVDFASLRTEPFHPIEEFSRPARREARDALEFLLERRVDALLIIDPLEFKDVLPSLEQRVSFLLVGQQIQGFENRTLSIDHFRGAYLATRHLLELSHQRVAHIAGPPGNPDTEARQEGYAKALEEIRLKPDPSLIVSGDFTEQSGVLALETLFAKGAIFSAIFAANDQMAYGARLALSRRGVRVPEDVSLVGYDDLHHSAFTVPPLTTVQPPLLEMGFAAAQWLVAEQGGESYQPPRLEAKLVVRESTAFYRRGL